MIFGPNDSPLAGRQGTQLTGSKIGERFNAEAETSVSLRVLPVDGGGESFEVQARGELQLGLLIGLCTQFSYACWLSCCCCHLHLRIERCLQLLLHLRIVCCFLLFPLALADCVQPFCSCFWHSRTVWKCPVWKLFTLTVPLTGLVY